MVRVTYYPHPKVNHVRHLDIHITQQHKLLISFMPKTTHTNVCAITPSIPHRRLEKNLVVNRVICRDAGEPEISFCKVQAVEHRRTAN